MVNIQRLKIVLVSFISIQLLLFGIYMVSSKLSPLHSNYPLKTSDETSTAPAQGQQTTPAQGQHFSHPLHEEYALFGRPVALGLKLGDIGKGADIVNQTAPVQGSRFSHPLHPEYPLIGELVNPVPGLQLGDIGKGADIVIGIPTVKRKYISYLESTLTSLFDGMFENPNSPHDISVKVLVFIAEVDEEFARQKMTQLNQEFSKQIKSKMLEVISVPTDYYPHNWAESLHLQFGDTLERTKWRSKQNLDQIFLMMYIYNLNPKYYLMLEDDVTAVKGYADHIMKFAAENESKDWFHLSFCMLGAIGKLFRARTLPSYASFIHTFWNRKPLDWLQVDYVSTQVCNHDEPHDNCTKLIRTYMISYKPSQFQHLGKISSLEGKLQWLYDKSFGRRRWAKVFGSKRWRLL